MNIALKYVLFLPKFVIRYYTEPTMNSYFSCLISLLLIYQHLLPKTIWAFPKNLLETETNGVIETSL